MSTTLAATISTAVPVILLILLGVLLRVTALLSDAGVEEIKALIVKVALPAVLFSAFLTIEFDARFLGLFVFVPIVLFLLLVGGYLLGRLPGMRAPVPFLMTGFEFGMLGISLFGTAYGMEQVGAISVVGLPHELFIWFLFVTLLRIRYGTSGSLAATARSFITSPVIVAIIAGTALNLLGAADWITTAVAPSAIMRAATMLGSIIGPLILIVIGHGTRLTLQGIADAAPVTALRFLIVGAIGLFVVPPVVEGILGLPRIFSHALFTFLILPPPFIIPLYIPSDRQDDLAYVNNVLSLSTVLSVAAFLVYFALSPA
jgi:predicted permease